ncbi:MAG: hypothetical protein JST00_04975 [Deltaproteobacteria bacterium]|nr:hypothetical protein [Deltaproteobacteria bacterium]
MILARGAVGLSLVGASIALASCGGGGGGASTTVAIPAAPPSPLPTAAVGPTPSAPPDTERAPPTPSAALAEEEARGPAADFTSFEAMKMAMKGAIGKVARLRLHRDHYTSGTDFTAETCDGNGSMRLTYEPAHRDHVRAMYRTPKKDCAFVTFRITGVDDRIAFFEGKTLRIFGVEPRAAVVPASGADFATIDDVVLAGDEAKDKIVDGVFWAYAGDPKMLWVHDCDRTDAMVFLPVKSGAAKTLAGRLSRDPRKCGRARLRIVDPKFFVGASDGGLSRPRAEIVSVP